MLIIGAFAGIAALAGATMNFNSHACRLRKHQPSAVYHRPAGPVRLEGGGVTAIPSGPMAPASTRHAVGARACFRTRDAPLEYKQPYGPLVQT